MRELTSGLAGAILGCVLGPVLGALGLWLSSLVTGGGTMSEGDFIGLFLLCVAGGAYIGGAIGVFLAKRE